jgi:hypothetical protein
MKKYGLVLLVCLLAGCVNSGELRQFPPEDYPRLTQESFSQEETVELEHITIRYVPHYEKGRQKVRISGSISLNRDKILPGSIVNEFALNLFGLDKEYTVINKGRFSRLSFPSGIDTIPFEMDIPYETAVQFISFKYKFNYIYDLA